MSTYTALYRKWRPKVFEEVMGQKDLIQALKNQIKTGNVGHAYLFSGTRGTGKTSTAKIFSRAINCLSPVDSNPCNACEICLGILDESLMDVVEIDAASNNGVDDIRELRENVKYPPSRSKYKVYIIDEVHMLSTGAFNALLKTLEEPPAYVVFILATTEPHKLPATILSRCQRFDFKRVDNEALMELLTYICEANQVKWEPEAIEMIIKKSDGAARDSLSMLDQCLSTGETHLTGDVIIKSLGLVQSEVISALVDEIERGNYLELFERVQHLIQEGKNLNQFVKDLVDYYRDLMMVASAGASEKVVKNTAALAVLEKQAKTLGLARILKDLGQLIDLDQQMKWSSNTRILMEMTLVKLAQNETVIVAPSILTQAVATGGATVNKEVVAARPATTVAKADTNPVKKETPKSPEKPVLEPSVTPMEGDPDAAFIESKWPEVLAYLTKNKKASLGALLVEGTFVGVSGKIVQIGYPELYGFHLNAIQKEENRSVVEKAIFAVTGYSVRAQFDFLEAFQVKKSKTDEDENSLEALKKMLGSHASHLEVIE
jgi:DNA polymerase-3 subunit gamma/tau